MAAASDSTSATTSRIESRSALAQHNIERIADGVFLREVRSSVRES